MRSKFPLDNQYRIFLLLRGNVWDTLASHIANPDRVARPATGGPRFLHTVRGVLANADLGQIHALLTAHLEQHILTQLAQRLAITSVNTTSDQHRKEAYQ
jgi:hypothetical protein